MPVHYLRTGSMVKVTDESSEYFGKVGRMIDDGGLADHGSNRWQFIRTDDGEEFQVRGYQLDFVMPNLSDIQSGYNLTDDEFRVLINEWIESRTE